MKRFAHGWIQPRTAHINACGLRRQLDALPFTARTVLTNGAVDASFSRSTTFRARTPSAHTDLLLALVR